MRRPGALPFAVELSPVSEALVVAGVIADPLDTAIGTEGAGKRGALRHARGLGARAGRVRAADREIRFAEGAASARRTRCRGWRAVSTAPTPSTSCRASSRAPRTSARAGTGGARRPLWRRFCSPCTSPRRRLQIRQAKHETAALDEQIASVFSAAMPADTLQDPRRQMQSRLDRIRKSGASPENFLRALQSLERRAGGDAEDRHRLVELSRGLPRHESERAEPRRALAALAVHRQARNDGGDSILHAAPAPVWRRKSSCATKPRERTDEQTSSLVFRLAAARAAHGGHRRRRRGRSHPGVGDTAAACSPRYPSAAARNETKREDLAWMQENAAEIRAAGVQLPADTGEAPVVLVDRIGREAGLGSALRGTQPSGSGGTRAARGSAVRYSGYLARHARRALWARDRIDYRRSHCPAGSGECQRHVHPAAALSPRPVQDRDRIQVRVQAPVPVQVQVRDQVRIRVQGRARLRVREPLCLGARIGRSPSSSWRR